MIVHIDSAEIGGDHQVGTLARDRSRTLSVISFAYSSAWLAAENSFAIDPELHLYEGEQHVRGGSLAGIFSDAAPDRWGRMLLERREVHAARQEGRKPRRLDDWDFLVGVHDAVRMGALRLAGSNGRFLDDRPLDVPPTTQLRDLEYAAREFERGGKDTPDQQRFLTLLLAPGSSLGGGRPKANFAADDRNVWIAKFPSRDDRHDVGAWEFLLSELAPRCGVAVPEAKLLRLGSEHRTFCARRFDRRGSARLLFASAMTLASKRDGDDASYLDIAEAVIKHGDPREIESDLEQLFRRALFNVLVGNRDDHLRNHGFLRTSGGWRLAPAFDLNPAADKSEHTLALDGAIRQPDVAVVRATAGLYQLSDARADAIVDEVRRGVSSWRYVARAIDIPTEEIDVLATALEAAEGSESFR